MATCVWAMTCGFFLTGAMLSRCSAVTPNGKIAIHPLAGLSSADDKAYTQFPEALEQIAASWLPTDDSGLIGRNRTWGELYSPRFQLGAGTALRIALAANRSPSVTQAFRAIEVATDTIQDNGYVPSTIPADLRNGREPSPAYVASGAAFFLGDACLGVLSLAQSTPSADVVSGARRLAVREDLTRAVGWLLTQQSVLLQADQYAPNRLLFNARSFQACGALTQNEALQAETEAAAQKFVEKALSLYSASGYFIEGGGHDTSYQGVAIRVGEDVLLAGYEDADGQLQATLTGAANWLARRVNDAGQIDSSGNQRTCEGGEVFLGDQKTVAVTDVFLGLAYASVRTGEDDLQSAAHRIEQWTKENRGSDPCFP